MSSEDEVRNASNKFYGGLLRMLDGDGSGIEESWSHDASVTTMHPIGGLQTGWDEVRGSFAGVAELASGGHAELLDQRIQVVGDLAYEIGVEKGQATLAGEQIAIEQRVTNIYRRGPEGWKIVHHHTDISPAMVAVLARLQQAA
jgi:ketosteroid isomerase-like protein